MKKESKEEFLIQKRFLKKTSILTTGATLLFLVACSIRPDPLTDWERAVRVDKDIQEMFQGQETVQIFRPLSLYDAMAMALKYNLNTRLKMMESALAVKQYDKVSFEMLPQITAGAGYFARNNYEAMVSKSMQTGVVSQAAEAYSEKTHGAADVQLTWNILDFGVSYYQAKQDANKILMAQEQRRKQMQSLLQDVRAAYWRALAAERLTPLVDDLMEEATFVLESLRATETKNKELSNVLLNYQMSLMETMRDLSEMKKELLVSRDTLSSLMNLKPGTRYRLVGPEEGNYTLPEIRSNLDRLEWLALMNRPELREEDYKLQNTREEAKKSLLKLMPNLNLSISGNYDSDSYLTNNSWLQAGLSLGWNLLNPKQMQNILSYGEVKEAVDNLNRQALAMTVLTQTHVGWGRYQGAKDTYQLSVEISDVAQKLAEQASDKFKPDVVEQAEIVSVSARALFAKLRSSMNFAELQDATGYMFLTIGLDPLPIDFRLNDLNTISQALERVMTAWDMGRFTNEDMPSLPPVPMRKPPVYINADIEMQTIVEDERFAISIPPTAFLEADLGHKVVYTASMLNGQRLPSWMFFDPKTITLSGAPATQTEGVYEIRIEARNRQKMSAFVIVTLQVKRGYKMVLDVKGASQNSRVSIIQRCETEGSCKNYAPSSLGSMNPEPVIVLPLPLPKKK